MPPVFRFQSNGDPYGDWALRGGEATLQWTEKDNWIFTCVNPVKAIVDTNPDPRLYSTLARWGWNPTRGVHFSNGPVCVYVPIVTNRVLATVVHGPIPDLRDERYRPVLSLAIAYQWIRAKYPHVSPFVICLEDEGVRRLPCPPLFTRVNDLAILFKGIGDERDPMVETFS
jgi:hypothetical protein